MSGFRCGLAAIVGRPNVGKSTLANRLVGARISITSRRAQTTRYRILGVRTTDTVQIVYVDTPGLHPPTGQQLNRYMNRIAVGSLEGVDVVVWVIDAAGWAPADDYPLTLLRELRVPVILAVNKIDRLRDKQALLPLIAESRKKISFADIVPISALKGQGVEQLEQAIARLLPEQPAIYPPDQLTDKSERFLAAELVREQIFRSVGQEVPYDTAVRVERFRRVKGSLLIDATILVAKEGQKAIVIGERGERLKNIGRQARLAMQKLFGEKVHLELWVKVKRGWADSERELRGLGYGEEA